MVERLEDIACDEIAAVVTHLELDSMPDWAPPILPDGWYIEQVSAIPIDRYIALFQSVGADYLWQGRLRLEPEALIALLTDANIILFILSDGSADMGFAELDFRASPAELAYFGLTAHTTGQGLGKALMHRALTEIFDHSDRACVHTCTLDHPAALGFYQHCGFRPVCRQIEVMKDPRALGLLPKTAAPSIPYLAENPCAESL